MYYTITKELLSENNKALQFLHAANGFDFEKDYFIAKLEDRFTFNTVKKAIGENLAGDYTAALILKSKKGYYSYNKLYYIGLDLTAGKFEPLRKENLTYWGFDIDYFFGKGDFEETRKNKTDHIYIIAQRNEYLTAPKEKTGFDPDQRFRYVPSEYGEKCGDGHGNTYINKITLMFLDGSAKQVEYKPYNHYSKDPRPASVSEVIDKSGYLIAHRRRELKRRAAVLRAEREKTAALNADFSNREKEIKAGIDSAKLHLAELALTIDSDADANAFDKTADSFRWLMFYYNRYTENAEKKAFASISAIENSLNDLQARINKVMGEKENA